MMKRGATMKRARRVMLSTLLALAMAAVAEQPEMPGPGMGKYVMFLRRPMPVPPGQEKKPVREPDVAKLGGRVLVANDHYRVIFLPLPAAEQLRRDENVDYLQRIWMGEPLEEWTDEDLDAAGPGLTTMSDAAGPTWGPKNYTYDKRGNIAGISADTYRYDAVDRITTAVVNGATETYEYDSFGNLTKKQIAGAAPSSFSVDGSSNRLSTETYDIAGNVTTNDGLLVYWYDSLGMMSGTNMGFMTQKRMYYTADDERIGTQTASSTTRWKVRDFGGKVLREFEDVGSEWFWVEDYAYANGQLVGGEVAGNAPGTPADRRRRHYHLDHLGTVRLVTTDGRLSLGHRDYYPFGTEQTFFNPEEATFGGGGYIRPEPLAYTGHERDYHGPTNVDNTEYLDYMHARYYNPGWGRFLSVDPGTVRFASPDNVEPLRVR
jgi:RHS repeat-associated protein